MFINKPDIFNTYDDNYYNDLQTNNNNKINSELIINNNILSAYKNIKEYLNYNPVYLTIYSIKYYYIAKSICERNDYMIINFCNFIHKFYLFNQLFITEIIKTCFMHNIGDIDRFNNELTHTKKLIIVNTLRRMNNFIFDIKLLNDYDVEHNDIYYFSDKFFRRQWDNYHGFTINFNFPKQPDDLEKMYYPKQQLDAITNFLYNYPEYLYYDFNAVYVFNINYFVETNIKEILENNSYKIKLDNCYRWLFYNAVKNNITSEINYFGKKIYLLNKYSFQSNNYDFRENRKSISKENELINKLKEKSSKGYMHFSTLEIKDYDIILRLQENGTLKEYTIVKWSKEFKLFFNTDDNSVYINEINKKLYGGGESKV